MPNWCECELRVSGDPKKLDEFEMYVKEGDKPLSENRLIPYPEKYRLLDEAAERYEKEHPGDWRGSPRDGFNSGGYQWCNENWGTKWGFCNVGGPVKTSEGLRYDFRTAWSPPTKLIAKAAELFPSLGFKLAFWERGAGFCGHLIFNDGRVSEKFIENYNGPRGG